MISYLKRVRIARWIQTRKFQLLKKLHLFIEKYREYAKKQIFFFFYLVKHEIIFFSYDSQDEITLTLILIIKLINITFLGH